MFRIGERGFRAPGFSLDRTLGPAALTYDPTTYTQTREIGFVERIGGSLIGIPIGIILIFFPISLLWWNEHRNVETQQAIDTALERVVTVPSAPLSSANEGKLVHVVGTATASAVSDPALELTLPSLLIAERRVEMYQWRENKSQQTGTNWGGSQTVTTAYSYDRVWSRDWLDSRNFQVPQGHFNPPPPARSALITADDAKLGAFRLGPTTLAALANVGLLHGNGGDEGVSYRFGPTSEAATTVPRSGFQDIRPSRAPQGYIFEPGGGLYRGKNPKVPEIGDLRVSYAGVPTGKMLTVVARQNGDGFTDYPVSRGFTLQLAAVGDRSAQALLDERAASEATLTWLLRLGGLVVMWIGFMMLLGPLAVLVSIVPFLGTLAEGFTADIAFFLALILSTITVAVAWLFVHPVTSIILIVVTLVLGGGYILIRRG